MGRALQCVPRDAPPGRDIECNPGAPADLSQFNRWVAALSAPARTAPRRPRRRAMRRCDTAPAGFSDFVDGSADVQADVRVFGLGMIRRSMPNRFFGT